MRITLPVTADTAANARVQAVSLLGAMGYRKVSNVRVLPTDGPQVADQFAMATGMRSFTVEAEAVRR